MSLGDVLARAGGAAAARPTWTQALRIFDEIGQPDGDEARARDAGHGEGMQPYQPAGNTTLANLGGTRAGNTAAQLDGWPKMLAMLAGLTATG